MVFAMFMLVSVVANAWSYDLPEENSVLQNETYNMRLFKSIDFYGGTVNGVQFGQGDGCLTIESTPITDIALNGTNPTQVTNPGLEFMYLQIHGAKGLNARSGVNKDGLHNYGSGARWFAFSGMKAGQIIVLQHSENTNDGKGNATTIKPNVLNNNSSTGWADVPTDPIQVEDITDAIHDLQDLVDNDGDGQADGTHDGFHYWKVLEDGWVYVDMERNTSIQGIQIWINADAKESVTAPSLKIVGVNGDSRKLEFKAGESTMGNETKTFYSIDGSDPIYLKDSEEVATWTYTYDETGAKLDSVPETYKKVLDTDMVAQVGTYGDYEFNPEDGSIDVFGSDDEDGDGIVVVKAAAVSLATGAVSDVVTINVPIGEITLNAPSASLVAANGEERTYAIAWTNNTYCGESYVIKVEGDNGEYYNEYEENLGIGERFTVKKNFKITVSVNGYKDGVYEQDADLVGTDLKRKNASQDAEGNTIHDYDFVNISKEMYDKFTGNVITSYLEYVQSGETTDTIPHTVEEYDAAEAEGVDVSGWVGVSQTFGWGLPISSNRTTLNVVEGGLDKNSNGYGYVEDEIGIFQNLAVSCPPNTKDASCIFKYIDRTDGNELGYLGVYFMAKPTITFPREVAKAGEYVEIYYGQGGSNYTNTTTHQFYEVPADGFLSVTLPSGGVHVFYIDVYTYDNLPEDLLENAEEAWKEVVAVDGVETENAAAVIYTVSGARIQSMQKGLNIVKYANGQVKKVFIK